MIGTSLVRKEFGARTKFFVARMYVIQASHQLSFILTFNYSAASTCFCLFLLALHIAHQETPALHCPYSHQSGSILMLRRGKLQRQIHFFSYSIQFSYRYEATDPPKAFFISRRELETETRTLVNNWKTIQFAQTIRRQKATVNVSLDGCP